MTACVEHLEAISAFADGEATESEVAALERHLKGCPACRQTFEAMVGLGSTLTALEPPRAPAGFAVRTAELVRQRSSSKGPGARLESTLTRAARWLRLEWLWQEAHPVAALATLRAQRKRVTAPALLFILGLFSLPALFLWVTMPDHGSLLTYLFVVGAGLMVGIPSHHFRTEVSVLASLRRGRCLEEILSTGISVTGTVDALATHSVRGVVRACLPVTPVLVLGSQALPEDYRGLATLLSLCWLPLTLLVFWAGSYACQFLITWSRDGEGASLPQAGLAVAVFGPALALASPVRYLAEHPALAGVGVLAAGLWIALTARGLAVWGLVHMPRLERFHRGVSGGGKRNRFLRAWSDNPVVVREMTRTAASVPMGLGGLMAWRVGMALFPLLIGAMTVGVSSEWRSTVLWGGLALYATATFLRAAGRTLVAVQGERERGSWDSLIQTGIGRDFLVGWVQVGVYSVVLDSLPVLGLALLAAACWPEVVTPAGPGAAWQLVLGMSALLLAVSGVGALTGLSLSASCASSREAGAALIKLFLRSVGGLLGVWGALAAGAYELAYLGMADSNSPAWESTVQHAIPLTAAGLVLAWLVRSSLSRLSGSLGPHLRVERAAEPVAARRGYPLSVLPLDVATLTLGACWVVFCLQELACPRWQGRSFAAMGQFQLTALLAMVGGALWVTLVRGPLEAAAELSRGRRSAPAVGILIGAVAGLAYPLAGAIAALLEGSQLIERVAMGSLLMSATSAWAAWMLPSELLGLALGMATGRAPRVDAQRARELRRRLLTLSVLAALVGGWLVWSASRLLVLPLREPELANRVLSSSKSRLSRLHSEEFARMAGHTYTHPLDFSTGSATDFRKEVARALEQQGDPTRRPLEQGDAAAELARMEGWLQPWLEHAMARGRLTCGPREEHNTRLLYRLGKGLRATAVARELRGDLEGAVTAYVDLFRLVDQTSGTGGLQEEMTLVRVTIGGVVQLEDFLARNPLTPAQYQRLLAGLEGCRLAPERLVEACDVELLRYQAHTELDPLPAHGRLLFHIYANSYLANREELSAAGLKATRNPDEARVRYNPLVPVRGSRSSTNYAALSRGYGDGLVGLRAARAAVRVLLEHARTGVYPDRLSEGEGLRYLKGDNGFRIWDRQAVYFESL